MGTGRPTLYDESLHPRWGKSLAKAGFTNEQMAEEFGVATSTFSLWLKDHQVFSDAVKEGRSVSDEKVVQSLYQLAIGYEQEVEKPMSVPMGNNMGSEVKIVKYSEKVQPNPTAIIFWLKNRRPKDWRDKQDVEHSGKIDTTPAVDLDKLSDAELASLQAMLEKGSPVAPSES